jgi:ABC-2 type transport system ATP-binding protein
MTQNTNLSLNQPMTIDVSHVNKTHGRKTVLKDITFSAQPGKVTAFLGPNGAGKSSTLRILLGLDYPDSGKGTFNNKIYSQLRYPLQTVGAVFDGIGGSPSRRVKTHLDILAQANGISLSRTREVLETVGLLHKSSVRLGTLSLGEGQRLGLAGALLGDPQCLVLDEPTNGLDPGGIRWFRSLIKQQAESGKTVLLSSHILAEVEQVADNIVIIDQGSIVASGPLDDIKNQLRSLEDVFFAVTQG